MALIWGNCIMAKAGIRPLFGDDFKTENMLYVAKNGSDSNLGTIVEPFLTITAANNYAITNLPLYPQRVTISVAPGVYVERIDNSHYRVNIVASYCTEDENVKSVIITNTGADYAHWPIATTGRLNIIGCEIQTNDAALNPVDGIFGQVSAAFYHCSNFRYGHFTENPNSDIYMNFVDCYMYGHTFKLEGVDTKTDFIALRNCDIAYTEMTLTSSGAARTMKFQDCMVGEKLNIGGDWSTIMQGTELYTNGEIVFDTDGSIDLFGNIIRNGIHFVSDTALTKKFVGNYFKDITALRDITAAVDISIVDYSGNKQDKGLCSCFQISGGHRNVGGFSDNRYFNLQEAITSIPAGESGTITLFENQSSLTTLALNTGSKITIKCSKQFSLSFTGNVASLGANQELYFHEAYSISGTNLEVNGASAILSFEGCLYVATKLLATSGAGSMIIAYNSSLTGITGYPVITMDNTDTLIVLGYSRAKGVTGQPAIKINVDADEKLKIKFSTLFHGDGLTNAPIVYTGASGKVDIAMYNSALNAALDASKFHNIIGSPNNTISAEINF